MRRLSALAALCALSAFAADTDPRLAQWYAVLPERAQVMALRGDPARGEAAFAICQGCHRAGGVGRADGSYPRLAGQHASVLIKQMTDTRAGVRVNPRMSPFVDEHALGLQEMADVAAWLARQPASDPPGQGPGTQLDRAATLYTLSCASCHGSRAEGDAAQLYPRLAGQHYRYLDRSTRQIRDGTRRNAHPGMVDAVQKLGDEDISALSDLLSRMRLAPPAE